MHLSSPRNNNGEPRVLRLLPYNEDHMKEYCHESMWSSPLATEFLGVLRGIN
jgi:hypothetical protein